MTDASWSDVSEPELPDAPPERRPSHYAAFGLGALLSVVLVVIVGVLFLRKRSDPSAANPALTTTAVISSATLAQPSIDSKPVVTPPLSVETAVVSPTPTATATPATTTTAMTKPTSSPRPTAPRPTAKPTSSAPPTVTAPAPPASAKPPPDTGLSNDRHG